MLFFNMYELSFWILLILILLSVILYELIKTMKSLAELFNITHDKTPKNIVKENLAKNLFLSGTISFIGIFFFIIFGINNILLLISFGILSLIFLSSGTYIFWSK